MNVKSIVSMMTSVRMSRFLASLIALAFVAALAGRAHADEQLPQPADEVARAHFDTGNKAFRGAQARTDPTVQRTEYEEAIKEYLAGLTIESKFHYSFYWNLGHAYRQIGLYTRADYFYKKFLEFAPARFALHRSAAEDFIRMMRAELDKAASLAEPTGPAPDPIRGPARQAGSSAPAGSSTPVEARSSFTGRRKAAVALWAVGAVSLGGGVALELASGSTYDDAKAATDNMRRHELTDSANQQRRFAVAATVAGVAAIGAGVFLWVSGVPTDDRAVAIAPLVTADDAGLMLTGRF